MSQENVDVVRRWTDAFNGRDYAALVELNDPGFEMKSLFAPLDSGGAFRAPEGFPHGYFEAMNLAYESFKVIPHTYIDAGDAVVGIANAEWRGRGSGVEGRTPVWPVWWLREGRIIREETFSEEAPALGAAGLRD
jgi:ketosteroid isomerase-like protein